LEGNILCIAFDGTQFDEARQSTLDSIGKGCVQVFKAAMPIGRIFKAKILKVKSKLVTEKPAMMGLNPNLVPVNLCHSLPFVRKVWELIKIEGH
jgi:hypothetical protein